jgi:hypothetical protein
MGTINFLLLGYSFSDVDERVFGIFYKVVLLLNLFLFTSFIFQ